VVVIPGTISMRIIRKLMVAVTLALSPTAVKAAASCDRFKAALGQPPARGSNRSLGFGQTVFRSISNAVDKDTLSASKLSHHVELIQLNGVIRMSVPNLVPSVARVATLRVAIVLIAAFHGIRNFFANSNAVQGVPSGPSDERPHGRTLMAYQCL
jgi:hypothetical protein